MIKKLMTAAALLAMAGVASAATLYTTGVLDFNKTTKGSYLGKIGAAVPVTVLKKQGNLSYVRISGWTLAEYPSMILPNPVFVSNTAPLTKKAPSRPIPRPVKRSFRKTSG